MRAQLSTIGLLGVLLITGCTTTTTGNAVPPADIGTSAAEPPPESSSVPEELPANGAPKVENPLDTQRFQTDPCLSLTSTQSTDLDLGANGSPFTTTFGNGCGWANSTTKSKVEVIFPDKYPVGLSGPYGANKAGAVDLFYELPPIAGYPAVVRNTTDNRDNGGCTVVVGVSDEIAFEVPLWLSRVNVGEKDPCEVAARVAGMVVQTIKKG